MSRRMTVKNEETGKTITFDWLDDANDPTDADFEEIFASSDPPAANPKPQVITEPTDWWSGAAKGFQAGARQGMSNIGKVVNTLHPPMGALGGLIVPEFVKEVRLPTAEEGRGYAGGAAAGLASAGLIAASPFSGGATLAMLPVVAGGASALTTKALGGDSDEVLWNGALDGAFGGLPGVGMAAKTGGRALVSGAFGLKRGANPELIEEAISSGIGASSRGMNKARDIINRLVDNVTKTAELLDQGTITARTGLSNMRRVREQAWKEGAPPDQLASLDALIESYADRFKGELSTAAAHQRKKDLYAPLEASFDQRVPSYLNQSKQAFAGGWREEVEKEATREGLGEFVKPVNARIGRLIELEQQLQKQSSRGVSPVDAVLGVMAPKAEAARMAFMPAPRAFLGRQLARTGDVITSLTDPFVQGAARAGGQSQLGGKAVQRQEAASAASIARQKAIRDRGRAARGEDPSHIEHYLLQAGVPPSELVDDAFANLASPTRTGRIPDYGDDTLDILQQTNPYTPEQLGIPTSGSAHTTNPLDAFDIPEIPYTGGRDVNELWLRKFAGPSRGPVRGVSAVEEAVQQGGVRGVAVDDTLANRRAAGRRMENAAPLTKQAVMEMYQRLQRVRNQLPPMGSHRRGLPES